MIKEKSQWQEVRVIVDLHTGYRCRHIKEVDLIGF